MISIASLLLAMAPTVSAAASVQDSLSRNNAAFGRCFEQAEASKGHASLRFVVGPDGRAKSIRTEDQTPASDELTRCLVLVVSGTTFEPEAIGADVVYPVNYEDRTEDAPAAQAAAPVQLSIQKREKPLLGDDWLVADDRGAHISDLELARLAGATELQAELGSKQDSLVVYSVIEGALATLGLVAAGIGAYRLMEGSPDGNIRGEDVGLAAGGGVVMGTAGLLFLYHVARAADVTSGAPGWHHLEMDEAEQLVSRANRARR